MVICAEKLCLSNYFRRSEAFKMAHTEDQWVRLFNVSDPRRAYAGYTLYKVTSKVFQKDFPEGITEFVIVLVLQGGKMKQILTSDCLLGLITVWRRFKDFKKLHQDLLKIYNQKCGGTNFPSFPKAKFFGRFDEAVIEERQKGALELLSFAGSIPDLFTSLPFVKFFEGGFPESPSSTKDNRSGSSSNFSDTEERNPAPKSTTQDIENENKNYMEDSKEFPSPALDKETGDYPEESLGGVWLCKQPSLSEGLDNASSDEEDSDDKVIPNSFCISNGVNPSGQIGSQKTEEEEDEVFNENVDDDSSNVCDIEPNTSATEPPNWLIRAISICSEGEDLEVLASGADMDQFDATLNFPQAFSDYTGSTDETGSSQCIGQLHSYKGSVHVQLGQDISHDCCSPQQNVDSFMHLDQKGFPSPCEKRQSGEIDPGNTLNSTDCAKDLSVQINNNSAKDSDSCKDSASIGTAEESQSFTSSSNSAKITMRQRTISDLGNICIDAMEGDYLYNAGHTIRKALDCEVNGMYEEAFSLYRTCVGLLLSGVQVEKDVKRREAVRRKTAQYLLKAEALYNTYLVENDSVENKQQLDASHSSSAADSENDDLKNFRNLTLAELKVIGIVGKVILVENLYSGETFVIKALHKSGHSRKHSSSHGSYGHQRKSHTCLYGKYPNIVRLYRFFETSTAVYLLLEYARGGKLWDHLQCYQCHRKSQDYLLGTKNNLDVNNVQQNSHEDVFGSNDGSADGRSKDNASLRLETFENSSKQEGSSWSDSNGTKTNDVPASEHNADEQEMKMSAAPPCNKRSLFTKLDEYFSSSVEHLPEENIRIWAAELVLAVGYLHTAGVLCRDLHPGNVLLDDEGHVLLSYFGSWEETAHVPDESAIDNLYCAPEVSHVEEVTPAADWWSVGALLYEIITSKKLSSAHPWGIKTHTELQLPVRISPEAKSLLKELLRVTPSERLGSGVNGIEDIKSHPFFSGINWTWLCSRIS